MSAHILGCSVIKTLSYLSIAFKLNRQKHKITHQSTPILKVATIQNAELKTRLGVPNIARDLPLTKNKVSSIDNTTTNVDTNRTESKRYISSVSNLDVKCSFFCFRPKRKI